jgi:hypothetical protein
MSERPNPYRKVQKPRRWRGQAVSNTNFATRLTIMASGLMLLMMAFFIIVGVI